MDVLISAAKQQERWQAAISECLPEARLHAGPDAPACDYAVVWQPPGGLFERQPRLKAVFSLGAGVDGLLASPSLPPDVPLVRMEDGGMVAQMEEYALYVALREFRRFPGYARAQAAAQWKPRGPRARRDFSIGVLGLGVLGGAVARGLADFGFAVSGWSRSARSIEGVQCEHGASGLEQVLARSELLLLFLPLTAQTRHLLDDVRLAQLPQGATLVNLSRGELVDDVALLHALDDGHLGGAYLDVFQHEPLPADHPYWRHSRVSMTPHVAAITDMRIASLQIAAKIRRFQAGEPIGGVVDRQRQY